MVESGLDWGWVGIGILVLKTSAVGGGWMGGGWLGGWVVGGWVDYINNNAHSGPTHRFFPQDRVWQ